MKIERKTLEKAIKNSEDINTLDELGHSALMLAAENGYTDIVKMLIKSGADINLGAFHHSLDEYHPLWDEQEQDDGQTALMKAVIHGHREIVKLLISNGAKVNDYDDSYYTPLLHAVENNDEKMVELLFKNEASISDKTLNNDFDAIRYNSPSALGQAVKNGNINLVNMLLEKHASPYRKYADGQTMLMTASQLDYYEIAKILIQAGVDVNARDCSGYTALIIATLNGNELMIDLLLKSGANKDYKTNLHDTKLLLPIETKFTALELAKLNPKNTDATIMKTIIALLEMHGYPF